MSALRIGIAGLGQMGGYHLRTWEGIEGAHVVAVADSPRAGFRSTCF